MGKPIRWNMLLVCNFLKVKPKRNVLERLQDNEAWRRLALVMRKSFLKTKIFWKKRKNQAKFDRPKKLWFLLLHNFWHHCQNFISVGTIGYLAVSSPTRLLWDFPNNSSVWSRSPTREAAFMQSLSCYIFNPVLFVANQSCTETQ